MSTSRHGVLVVLACALWASPHAARAAPVVAQVRLSVKEPPRVKGVAQVRAGGVLRLRVVEPGRLEVKVGGRAVAAGHLGWGEDERLLVIETERGGPRVLPRVVSAEPGREEVEVALPEEAEEDGEERHGTSAKEAARSLTCGSSNSSLNSIDSSRNSRMRHRLLEANLSLYVRTS